MHLLRRARIWINRLPRRREHNVVRAVGAVPGRERAIPCISAVIDDVVRFDPRVMVVKTAPVPRPVRVVPAGLVRRSENMRDAEAGEERERQYKNKHAAADSASERPAVHFGAPRNTLERSRAARRQDEHSRARLMRCYPHISRAVACALSIKRIVRYYARRKRHVASAAATIPHTTNPSRSPLIAARPALRLLTCCSAWVRNVSGRPPVSQCSQLGKPERSSSAPEKSRLGKSTSVNIGGKSSSVRANATTRIPRAMKTSAPSVASRNSSATLPSTCAPKSQTPAAYVIAVATMTSSSRATIAPLRNAAVGSGVVRSRRRIPRCLYRARPNVTLLKPMVRPFNAINPGSSTSTYERM